MDVDLSWCDVVLVHGMTKNAAKIINLLPPNKIIMWSGWGSDYWPILRTARARATLSQTSKFVKGYSSTLKELYKQARRHSYKYIKEILNLSNAEPHPLVEVLNKIDYFSGFYDAYVSICAKFDNFSALYVEGIKYCSVEDVYSQGAENIYGHNILVGHAALPSMNHIDAFELLRDIDLRGRKIVIPVSYGDKKYARHLIHYGKQLFGDNLLALTDFMEIEEYHNILCSCSVMIINSRYDQAFGTVSTGLYKGAKVYIRGDNNIYSYYKKNGSYIFDIYDIELQPHGILCGLPSSMKDKNRCIIEEIWAYDAVVSELKDIISLIRRRGKVC